MMRLLAVAAVALFGLQPHVASATDLPILGGKAVDDAAAVDVCDAYGKNFHSIEGTNTCIRIGGAVRFDFNVLAHNGVSKKSGETTRLKSGAAAVMESRTETDFGPLRTYTEVEID